MQFKNRTEAGQKLARTLNKFRQENRDYVVAALARGGVPIGYEIAQEMKIPLIPFIVRKLGSPYNKEHAVGAIAEGDVVIIDKKVQKELHIPDNYIAETIKKEAAELVRRKKEYLADREVDWGNKSVIVVDDGIATGLTMEAAVKSIRKQNPTEIIIAVPVIALEQAEKFKHICDVIVWISAPNDMFAIGQYYEKFDQVSDEQVISLLGIRNQ